VDHEPATITYQPHLTKEGLYNVYGWWAKEAKAAPKQGKSTSNKQAMDGCCWVLSNLTPEEKESLPSPMKMWMEWWKRTLLSLSG
jgi:hypothetical protein